MSAEFRHLAVKGRSDKAEKLFRAAVSAFCALTRPTRRDAAQLDDLAFPLFDSVSPSARRFAAAALAECDRPPAGLIRRLVNEPVEVSAPLLIRSESISDADLITAIGRHGLPHARAIARRRKLHPAIAGLLDAFKDSEIQRLRSGRQRPALRAVEAAAREQCPSGEASENVRRRLRAMMLPSSATEPPAAGAATRKQDAIFVRLRDTGLSGHLPLFETALADALGVDFAAAKRLTRQESERDLTAVLCRLGLSEEQAFLVLSAVFPAAFRGAEAISLFLYRYRRLAAAQSEAEAADALQAGELTSGIRSSAA